MKIGRNDKCPCGSGLKFKRCCLNSHTEGGFQGSFEPLFGERAKQPTLLGYAVQMSLGELELYVNQMNQSDKNQSAKGPGISSLGTIWLQRFLEVRWSILTQEPALSRQARDTGAKKSTREIASHHPMWTSLEFAELWPEFFGLHPILYHVLFTRESKDPKRGSDPKSLLDNHLLDFEKEILEPCYFGFLSITNKALASHLSLASRLKPHPMKNIFLSIEKMIEVQRFENDDDEEPSYLLQCREILSPQKQGGERTRSPEEDSQLDPIIPIGIRWPEVSSIQDIELFACLLKPIAGVRFAFLSPTPVGFVPGTSLVVSELAASFMRPIEDVLQDFISAPFFQFFSISHQLEVLLPFMDKSQALQIQFRTEESKKFNGNAFAQKVKFLLSQDQNLLELFLRVWRQNVRAGQSRMACLPTETQFRDLIGCKPKRSKTAKNGTLFQSELGEWRFKRGHYLEPLSIEDLKCQLFLSRVQEAASAFLRVRGLGTQQKLLVVFHDSEYVELRAKDCCLQLPTQYASMPWSAVEDTLEWAMFELLKFTYIESGMSNVEAAELAANRCGLLLNSLWVTKSAQTRRAQDFLNFYMERELSEEQERTLRKVEKLFNLSQSSFKEEAELAMEKAHLLLKSARLDWAGQFANPGSNISKQAMKMSFFYAERSKRVVIEIVHILTSFYGVRAIWRTIWDPAEMRDKKGFDLFGSKLSLLMAEHVMDFLSHQIDLNWRKQQKEKKSPSSEKVSYQVGLLHGFASKLRNQKNVSEKRSRSDEHHEPGLIALEQDAIADAIARKYPKTTSSSSSMGSLNQKAYKTGHHDGSDITLNTPIGSRSESQGQSHDVLRLS